ncbi:MAG TPA: alpha/beta fold hydrolase [Terriglobales bacterium]
MTRITSNDAELVYEIIGHGPPVVLLHPFPVHHEFWLPAAQALSTRYRLVLPDLRGHGDSRVGEGSATMEKHAADVARICDQEGIGRAAFAGVSIGGYLMFEFWRRYRERVAALALCNTRSQAETAETRAARLKSAADVLERGTGPFIDAMMPRVFGKTTLTNRPDLIDAAQRMMRKMSPQAVNQVQKGMAERPDSVSTLKTINVPTLIIGGAEDVATPVADAELMRQNIPGAQLKVIPRSGHYAVFEQPEEAGSVLRQFLDDSYRS